MAVLLAKLGLSLVGAVFRSNHAKTFLSDRQHAFRSPYRACRALSVSQILRIVLQLGALVALVFGAMQLADWVKDFLDMEITPHTEAMAFRLLMISLLIYAVLIALPFVPGAEIGLSLIAIFGAGAAPFVYLATLAGLCLAYFVGALVPIETTCRIFKRMGLHRMAALVRRADQPGASLADVIDNRWGATVARHRHLAFGLLLNVPGNMVLGGGGGLSLFAGLCRAFHPLAFVATVAIAVAPIPFTVYVLGVNF